jgi:hypothetical protein
MWLMAAYKRKVKCGEFTVVVVVPGKTVVHRTPSETTK